MTAPIPLEFKSQKNLTPRITSSRLVFTYGLALYPLLDSSFSQWIGHVSPCPPCADFARDSRKVPVSSPPVPRSPCADFARGFVKVPRVPRVPRLSPCPVHRGLVRATVAKSASPPIVPVSPG